MNNNQIYKGIHQQLQGFYKIAIVNGSTKEVVWEQKEWKKNLILNQGMDEIYILSITDLMTYAAAGAGTRPNSIDGGISEITQSGTTVYLNLRTGLTDFTSSAGTTYASVVQSGDMIKYLNNSESMVTSVTNGFNLEVSPSYTFTGGQTFDIWKTSQIGLESETVRNSSYTSLTPGNTSTVVNVRTHRRSYDFPAEGVQTVYNELGICWAASGATTVFSRILLSPSITIDVGYQLRVIYDLQTTWLPATVSNKSANVGNWPIAPATNQLGSESIQVFLTSTINASNGASINTSAILDPYFTTVSGSNNATMWISPSTASLAAFGSAVNRSTNAAATSTVTKASYPGAGSYYCDKSATFSTAQANRTDLGSVGIGKGTTPYDASNQAICFKFVQTQSKDSSHTLSFTYRFSWGRTLV